MAAGLLRTLTSIIVAASCGCATVTERYRLGSPDLLPEASLGLGVDYLQRGEKSLGLGYLAGAIAALVLNRLIALAVQLRVVQLGNAAAAEGLWLDPSRAPERLPDES